MESRDLRAVADLTSKLASAHGLCVEVWIDRPAVDGWWLTVQALRGTREVDREVISIHQTRPGHLYIDAPLLELRSALQRIVDRSVSSAGG